MPNPTRLGSRAISRNPGIMDRPVSPPSEGTTMHRPEVASSLPQLQVGDSALGSAASSGEPGLMPMSGRSGSERYHLRYNTCPSRQYPDFALG
ncbi:hypothetical protein NDU88_003017 [Pleurodeles waltl]|uniref:Uncharacterized protein n=1 Tax=Pleurodeles waltl TaxID=8319 RepID=A0AAV7PB31_PLEWA|nr:hypothetical protein NDU88_003017 [Pleurodeles waltl]